MTIDCSFKFRPYSANLEEKLISSGYACDAAAFSRKCDPTGSSVFGVSNNHLMGKENADVQMVLFKCDQDIPKMPKNMEKFFQNITALRLHHIRLREISSNDLQYPNLKYLDAGNNKLVILQSDLFKHTPSLEVALFDDNQLKSIAAELVNSAPKMRVFHLNDNECTRSNWGEKATAADLKRDLDKRCPIQANKAVGKKPNENDIELHDEVPLQSDAICKKLYDFGDGNSRSSGKANPTFVQNFYQTTNHVTTFDEKKPKANDGAQQDDFLEEPARCL